MGVSDRRNQEVLDAEEYIDMAFVDENLRTEVEKAVVASLVLSATYSISTSVGKYIQIDKDMFLSFWISSNGMMRIAIEGSWSKKCTAKGDPDVLQNLFKLFCVQNLPEYVNLSMEKHLNSNAVAMITIKRIINSLKVRKRATAYKLANVGEVLITPITGGRMYIAQQ
jgi:hypothetical protein|nr:MAG TPA: hypothetical protein [Caudoviricetes sp.]